MGGDVSGKNEADGNIPFLYREVASGRLLFLTGNDPTSLKDSLDQFVSKPAPTRRITKKRSGQSVRNG